MPKKVKREAKIYDISSDDTLNETELEEMTDDELETAINVGKTLTNQLKSYDATATAASSSTGSSTTEKTEEE